MSFGVSSGDFIWTWKGGGEWRDYFGIFGAGFSWKSIEEFYLELFLDCYARCSKFVLCLLFLVFCAQVLVP